MPVEITMPQLSDTMTDGTVVKWHKKEGEKVNAGEEIADIETDKAVMPMEAFESGTLAAITVPEGQSAKVGAVLAVIATPNENAAEIKQKASGGGGSARPAEKPAAAPVIEKVGAAPSQPNVTTSYIGASNAEMREPDHSHAHGPTRENISTEPHKEDHAGDGRIRVSPLAKRIAAERGVDLSTIKGSGPGGRIVKQDVVEAPAGVAPLQRAAQAVEARPLKPQNLPVTVMPQRVAAGATEVISLSKMRTVIAKRLQASKQNVPHFYESVDCEVELLTQLRARLNEQLKSQNIKLSLGDLVAKAVATALEEHPALNAHFNGNEIIRYGDVNLGMAVALPEGLIVPVLRGVNHMGFREIRVRSHDLVERARAQRLKQDEMMGATFTVSNLGMFGVREFSAIINPPEVGILAIGGAEKRAVVRNDQIVARTMMTLTLSCDHRAVDGATAAEFLGTLRQLLEEPALMLA